MNFFGFLWIPLFFLFWRSINRDAAAGGVWALLPGSIAALCQFFLGPLVEPGGFGFSRWLSGCVDIVAVPALLPVLVCGLLVLLRVIPGTADFAGFSLFWLVPSALVRALNRSSENALILFVLVPVLWTAITVGVSFFIRLIIDSSKLVLIFSVPAILIIPFAAAGSYWAFFSHKTSWGFLFLAAAALPMLVSVITAFIKADE